MYTTMLAQSQPCKTQNNPTHNHASTIICPGIQESKMKTWNGYVSFHEDRKLVVNKRGCSSNRGSVPIWVMSVDSPPQESGGCKNTQKYPVGKRGVVKTPKLWTTWWLGILKFRFFHYLLRKIESTSLGGECIVGGLVKGGYWKEKKKIHIRVNWEWIWI